MVARWQIAVCLAWGGPRAKWSQKYNKLSVIREGLVVVCPETWPAEFSDLPVPKGIDSRQFDEKSSSWWGTLIQEVHRGYPGAKGNFERIRRDKWQACLWDDSSWRILSSCECYQALEPGTLGR